jgi:hypothetical protein
VIRGLAVAVVAAGSTLTFVPYSQGTENAWCPWVRISVDSARPTPFLNTDTESFVREGNCGIPGKVVCV